MTTHLRVIKGGEAMGMGLADYVWLNDHGNISFKKKSVLIAKDDKGDPAPLADRWTLEFCPDCDDEHRTERTEYDLDECECEGATSRILVPCFYLPDPTRPQPNYIVLCELRDADDHCIESNWRSKLRKALEARGKMSNLVWFGFEQDYEHQEAGDGEDEGFEARRFAASERHIGACFDAGLLFHSAWNPPGGASWDFKVGYRGFPQDLDPDPPNALIVADHLIIARYLMEKIGGSKGLVPAWDDLSVFISTPDLRDISSDAAAEAHRLKFVLSDLGRTRHLPHPTQGGYQCIQVHRDEFADPYKLALDVLTAVWPPEETPTNEE